ncbi:MAG TPA: hypothetical protein DER09_00920 [Prolixibacteraceae bacterium]|nr:hypothetical protein [Prolixibacteraceae bacterium]
MAKNMGLKNLTRTCLAAFAYESIGFWSTSGNFIYNIPQETQKRMLFMCLKNECEIAINPPSAI